ncbi:hypothetical protein F5X71_08470 [Nocardia brasiliensis]|uniref:Uncharacterized protein n=1 Tax=Nocardia brasiliensis TaxID=37326 RepID=A0A6G9XND0_NOCBR|nr:hypothetical protein [Nocardia brasiliensis]QIS02353.1 hypothetical protein F5X71_08470 [Nocardia brasiliensis]
MFEYWTDEFSSSLWRVVDPPKPVLVELGTAISTITHLRGGGASLRVKSAGLDLRRTVPGLVHAWAECIDGSWIGLCSFVIPTADQRGHVPAFQWCPRRSLIEPKRNRRSS